MTRPARHAALPPTLAPIGLDRVEAAAYVGVSSTKFDDMVRDGRMPPAKRIDGRRVWHRPSLEKAFVALEDDRAAAQRTATDEIWETIRV